MYYLPVFEVLLCWKVGFLWNFPCSSSIALFKSMKLQKSAFTSGNLLPGCEAIAILKKVDNNVNNEVLASLSY